MHRRRGLAADARRTAILEHLYDCYNRREMAHPDPVEFLYRFEDVRDREIAALVVSSIAYGRLRQIGRSVSAVLSRMRSPSRFLKTATRRSLERAFGNFAHRFSTGEELVSLCEAIRKAISLHGSLEACFTSYFRRGERTVLPALTAFVEDLIEAGAGRANSLLSSPRRGSACKRLNLFLRWMVRRDEIDPGGWEEVPPSALVVPLDTHMFRMGRALGFTERRRADMRAAIEVTEAFRGISPRDPVKYDFALTRVGIRGKSPGLSAGPPARRSFAALLTGS